MQVRTRFIQILFLAVTFVFLAVWTWRKGADIFVDFGLQLYLPWQLASGKLLYRDVAYLAGGPISQYFNAALFKLFGTSVTTLIMANLAIVILLISVIFRFFEKISDATCATAACFVVLVFFAFSGLTPAGNYNYVYPYCHEALHGLVFSVLAIVMLSRWILDRSIRAIFLAGLCVGLVFLTKPEIFLALFLTAIFAFAIHALHVKEKTGRIKNIAYFLSAMAVPAIIAFSYFKYFQPTREALRAVAWAWVPLIAGKATSNKYYIWTMGLDHPVGNSVIALMQFIAVSIAIALCAWCGRVGQRNVRHYFLSGIIFTILVVAVLRINWFDGARVLFFLTPAISLFLIWHWWKSRESNPLLIPAILWSAFAVVMLAKMGFFSKIWHYGAFLAMPAAALGVYFVFGFLPKYLVRWNVHANFFRLIFSALLLIASGKMWLVSNDFLVGKNFKVGRGGDEMFAVRQPIGQSLHAAANWITTNTPENATFTVLPEGIILNYLTRRINPTPYGNFMLPEWQTFGEPHILQSLQKALPDYIVLIDKDTKEYGMDFFGKTEIYGLKTMQWINQNYSQAFLIGREPLQNGRFGIKILKLNLTETLITPSQVNSASD